MYLHENKELFKDVIIATSNNFKKPIPIIEKDYYITEILRCLSEIKEKCVFKGGTELSKCHKVIDRFSEDIDIAFTDKLSRSQRKKLKNESIISISKNLNLPIVDWDNARSNRDYNCYTFNYDPIEKRSFQGKLVEGVKTEIVLGSLSFPTEIKEVQSFVYDYLLKDNEDIIKEYNLYPFNMIVQSIERTFIDKVFALCDYYMEGEIERHSRHLYDLYMLFPKIEFNDKLKELVKTVREHRSTMSICPSATFSVNINDVLNEIVDKNTYKQDYDEITIYFQNNPVAYERTIETLKNIIDLKLFV